MKIRSIIASVAAAFSISAFADTEVVDGIEWYYYVQSGHAVISQRGALKPSIPATTTGDITIPQKLGGHNVTIIGSWSFNDCEKLGRVTIPDGVTTIDDYAFNGSSITGVSIPSSVTFIGDSAFGSTGLTEIEVPSSVTYIDRQAFANCISLFRAVLPAGITSIEEKLFVNCLALQDVNIPDSVLTIGVYAFNACPLKSIVIPNGVTTISETAFSHTSLTSVKIPASVTSIGWDAFKDAPLSTVYVEDVPGESARVEALLSSANCDTGAITVKATPATCAVTFDANGGTCDTASRSVLGGAAVGALPKATKTGKAFMGWYTKKSALGTRIWPSTVVEADVAYYARWTDTDCTSWTDTSDITWYYRIIDGNAEIYRDGLWAIPVATEGEIAVPSIIEDWPVTSIGDEAFTECKKLTKITIPSSVTSIGDGAFFNCKKVTEIVIPPSVTSIGESAFAGCDGLCDKDGFLIRGDVLCNYSKSGDVTVPSSVKRIAPYAFFGKGVNNVILPEGVTSIGENAFDDCQYLETISVPKTLTVIGANAFRGNYTFTTVYVADASEVSRVKQLFEDAGSDTSSRQFVVKGSEGSCTVTFNATGGTSEKSSVAVAKGSAVGSLPKATRTGYSLVGWFTSASGGTQVTTSTKVTANVTYYAQWTANTYTLKLHRNNSSGDTATAGRSLTYDTARALPKIETELKWAPRTDYDFLGWATSAGATSAQYTDGQSVKNLSATQGATVHVYAVWKKKAVSASTYILRLHRNNSERDGATAGRTYTIGKARALPKIQNELKWAPRKGYDFLGWSKSATATTAQYTDGQSLKDLTKTAGAEVHLYAVWKAHKYIVRLHRNNSVNDGATTGRAFDYDQVRFLPTMAELKWVRSGYMFMGWSQAQNSTTVKYADGLNVYNLSPNDGEELHVWGVWKKAETGAYLLRLHRNNSERDGATAGRQLKLNTNRKLPTVKELNWARTDATFKGWATTAKNATAGKVTYKDGATVKNLVSTPGDTVHLYAVWQ